jgi:hypothetical protein
MADSSIFTKLVRGENDLSHVLVEVMRRDEVFRSAAMTLFFGDCAPALITPDNLAREVTLRGHGRPDVVARSRDFLGIVEIKAGATFQDTQKPTSPIGYAAYLSVQTQSIRCLSYLLPDNEDVSWLTPIGDLKVRIIRWRDLQALLIKDQQPEPWARELRLLLDQRFGRTIGRAEAKEMAEKLPDNNTLELCKLIICVASLASSSRVNIERSEGEFGFQTKGPGNNGLFFGYVGWAREAVGSNLVFGINEDWDSTDPGLTAAFSQVCKGATIVDTWQFVPITAEEVMHPNAARMMWERLHGVIERVNDLLHAGAAHDAEMSTLEAHDAI